MTTNRKLLSPLSILMLVIVLAAIATWLIPSGRYDRLSYTEGNNFSYNSPGGDLLLPLTQPTLDSLKINIPLANFKTGAIKKPVAAITDQSVYASFLLPLCSLK
jgi:uncharacterized ion transporter superfamily protein YfcC